MPELPEVETIRRSLLPRILGRRIVAARLRRRDVLVVPGDPPTGFSRARAGVRPRAARPGLLLVGGMVSDVSRMGKHLAVQVRDGRAAAIHLGMSGQLRWLPPGGETTPARHEHLTWRLDDGARLAFRDPRRFGGVWVFPNMDELRAARWAALGDDALSITPSALAARLAGSTRPIKAALLDQTVIAGVGNIYADEALFAARVSPVRASGNLTPPEVRGLVRALKATLRRSIRAGGSTLRDYVDANGSAGANQHRFTVYGSAGKPCPGCGGALAGLRVAQRATVMCPRCQG